MGILQPGSYTSGVEGAAKLQLNKDVLISGKQIAIRVTELAREISTDYANAEMVALVVLRGGFVFAADLVRALAPEVEVMIDFMSVRSYGEGTSSSGQARLVHDSDLSLEGKDVLIIEDIVETGLTLDFIRERVEARGAKSVRFVTLLEKTGNGESGQPLDYVGFRIPDVFVVGYGLDFAQRYRHLPDIRVLVDE